MIMVEGRMKRLLQAEGLALFVASLVAFSTLNASWWMYALLFFVPDLSFAAYLVGARAGALVYNVLHSTIGPILLAGIAWWLDFDILGQVLVATAVIWIGHIGFDRMMGYGLKYSSGFKDTHLGKL
jgi:Domain of unknown function (DUF4260)